MKLTIKITDDKITICEKGSGAVVYVLGSTDIPCDGLLNGYNSLPINSDDYIKHTYADYMLNHALNQLSKYIESGISVELAMFDFKKLFCANHTYAHA